MKRLLLLAICLAGLTLQVFAQEGFTTKPDERAVNIANKFIAAWQNGNHEAAAGFASSQAVDEMFVLHPVADEKIEFVIAKYLPKKKRWIYQFVMTNFEKKFGLHIIKTKRSFKIVAVDFNFRVPPFLREKTFLR